MKYFSKKLKFLFLTFFLLTSFSGCARILGTYVSQPQPGQEGRYSQEFDLTVEDAYQKVKVVLKELDAYLFVDNSKKPFISAMRFDKSFVNCIDTTEVGIFFESESDNKTKVDVACGNVRLAKFVADKIFSALSN